ncbi:endonuclease [Bacteroidia bacterium]|nr:endonuclease [Bacteroidia bacterium]
MKKLLLIFGIIFSLNVFSQNDEKTFRIASYNVENLFDTKNDSLTADEEFLPDGNHHWTYFKYKKKLSDIGKTIIALGEWEMPALVGLCEIENEAVLWDLVRRSPLENAGYSFVHRESPDARGVDVALLYRRDKFKLLRKEFLTMKFKTREILYATGIAPSDDTLHVFVCHFPSRLGGELESEDRRVQVAAVLRRKVDSIYNNVTNPRIVIMGDFNDMPDNRSITVTLKARQPKPPFEAQNLYNLAYPLYDKGLGTYKLAGEWNILDQIIVSGALLTEENKLHTKPDKMQIYSPDFLRETDETKGGFKPFRTFLGQRYIGGVSDHFPVYVDFYY